LPIDIFVLFSKSIRKNKNKKMLNIKYNTVQVLQIVGDKFAAVVTDINGIGLHVKPVSSKITVWTSKITLSNYKNILNIGYVFNYL